MSELQKLDFSVLQQCMHCGLCLPSCPTFQETGRERHSPRGRIALMRAVAENELPTSPAFAEEMSYCLGCLACTSACPAGVDYAHLLETARAHVESSPLPTSRRRRFWRWLTLRQLFPFPERLRAAGLLLRFYQRSGLSALVRRSGVLPLLAPAWAARERAAPLIESRFSDQSIAAVETPPEPARFRVLLLTGCVQDLAFASVNRDTADVLLANGCTVVTPRAQSCCGSLHAHNGDLVMARELARRQLDAYPPSEYDAIISNAAGCGSHLRHYDRLLADDPAYIERARLWSSRLRDIHEWLVEIGLRTPKASVPAQRVTYHEACHLCHGQKISTAPRTVLRAVPGLELVELKDATVCCGSAGIYSLTHPDTAGHLREQKLQHIRATGAAQVAVANPGCTVHLAGTDASNGLTFDHPVSLLARAYRAERAG